MAGEGFTVTSTVVSEFEHPPDVAVMVYLTTSGIPEVLTSVCEMEDPLPGPNPVVAVAGTTNSASQEKTVPVRLLDSEMLVVFPEQID